MSKLTSLLAVLIFGLGSFAGTAQAQLPEAVDKLLSKSTIGIYSSFLNQNNTPVSRYFDQKKHFFDSNPSFGVEMNYAFTDHFSVGLEMEYGGSKRVRNENIIFFIAPPPGTLSNFEATYYFRTIAFQPKAILNFDLQDFGFFWSAGPVFSTAVLNANYDASTYGEPEKIVDTKSSFSASLGIGAQASTGLNYFINSNIGISAEVGYKYLTHTNLKAENKFMKSTTPFQLGLNSVYNRIGLIYKF